MDVNRQQDFNTIMECIEILFSSSEEDDDEEFLQLAILHEKNKIPKLKNFIAVVHKYSNNDVTLPKICD